MAALRDRYCAASRYRRWRPKPAPDVCAGVSGQRVSAGRCANVADAVAPYVPPPAYYAPMPYDPPPPPNVTGCVSYNGRWVNAAGCN
jgi:hypothetical protein